MSFDRLLQILGIALAVYLLFSVYSCMQADIEHFEAIGNEKVLVIRRTPSGSILRCYETYRKDLIESDTSYLIRDRVEIPSQNTEVYFVDTYTEGYHENGLDACFRNLITH